MAVAVDRAPSLDFGSQEASRLVRQKDDPCARPEVHAQLEPRSRGDRLLAAIAALISLKNLGEDEHTVASTYLAPDVVMHADAAGSFWSQDKVCTLSSRTDITRGQVGVDAFLAAPQQYGSTYSFTRHLIATATNPQGDWAFAWWVDQDLTVNNKDLPAGDSTSNVIGLWAAKGDEQGKLTDLWFFRQLTPSERALRFKDPATPFQNLDTHSFKEPSELPHDPDRTAAMMEAARRFDGMYAAGNTDAAADILSDSVVSYDLLFGSSSSSRQEWVRVVYSTAVILPQHLQVEKHNKLFSVRCFLLVDSRQPSTGP